MNLLMILPLLFVVGNAQISQLSEDHVCECWETYKKERGKSYTPRQEIARKNCFRDNLRKVTDHNTKYVNGEVTFKMELNQFADSTAEEIRASRTGLRVVQESGSSSSSVEEEIVDYFNASKVFRLPEDIKVPASVDWRTRGAVTPIKDQLGCGSCWAFSCTGGLEGQYFLQSEELVSFSEQHFVECVERNWGCDGGYMDYVFEYLQENRTLHLQESYPYLSTEFDCKRKESKFTAPLKEYVNIPSGDEKQLQLALATVGPISVGVMVTDEFMLYAGGVFSVDNCENRLGHLNHAVTLVGYGTHWTGQEVWLLKNQWGTDWGLRGYMLLARNKDNMCGIATMASYPVFSAV